MNTNRGIRILALDGGGMRGLSELTILRQICKSIFGDDNVEGTHKLFKSFDMICGTSTGSIISVAMIKKSFQHCEDLYYQIGNDIFQSSIFYGPGRWLRYATNGNYYDSNILTNILEKDYGQETLNKVLDEDDPKMFITGTDATTNIFEPYLFRSYDNPNSRYHGCTDISLIQAVKASCSAPTYFSPVTFKDKLFVDGGFIYNNPTELAIFESNHLWKDREIECIVSIGSGLPKENQGAINMFSLFGEIVDICTNSNLIHQRVLSLLDYTCQKPLYLRFNAPSPIGSIPLDCSDKATLVKMCQDTAKYMEEIEQLEKIEKLRGVLLSTDM